MFKNPLSLKGRIGRLEYIISVVLYLIITKTLKSSLGVDTNASMIIQLFILWLLLAQSVKRSHDRGNSGWWIFIPFYVLFLIFANSEEAENEYGTNPKKKI
jgi:uncharacterized membrane protein YhaH (DUF805 family)